MLLALLGLWAGATWFKAARVVGQPEFSRADDTALFWSQDAVRYRYAKMLAAGMAMPERDMAFGWPQGSNTLAADSWVFEKLAAVAYQKVVANISPMPFHVFLVWWWSALTALAIWPVYALSRHVWKHRLAGLASACLWASAFGGLHATAVPRLAVEDVGLPWLFLTVHFALTAVSHRRLWRAVLAAGCCWWTLAIWPGATWFLFLMMLVAAAIDLHHLSFDLVTELKPGATARTIQGRSLYAPVVLLAVAVAGAGLTQPPLQAREVAWSWPVAFGAAWVLMGGLLRWTRLPLPDRWRVTESMAGLMPREFRWRRRMISVALYAVFFGVLMAAALAMEWRHGSRLANFELLGRLASAKLVCFGQMPLLPHVLDDRVRLLWSCVAQSPAASVWWLSAAGLIVLAPLAIALPFIQARHVVGAIGIASGVRVTLPFERAMLATLTVLLALLWLMAARLDSWFAWAAAVMAGSLVDFALNVGPYPPLWRLGNRPRIFAAGLLGVALLANAGGMSVYSGKKEFPSRSQLLALVKQIRYQTEPDAPLAAPPQLDGALVADTGRPVLLQTNMLDEANRKALLAFDNALFGPEEALAAYCRQRGARYLVLDVETLTVVEPGHARYDSNHPIISPDVAAYWLHFEPAKLSRFQLVYTGPLYRLYRVLALGETAPPVAPTPLATAYYPTWDRANFSADRLRLLPEK